MISSHRHVQCQRPPPPKTQNETKQAHVHQQGLGLGHRLESLTWAQLAAMWLLFRPKSRLEPTSLHERDKVPANMQLESCKFSRICQLWPSHVHVQGLSPLGERLCTLQKSRKCQYLPKEQA